MGKGLEQFAIQTGTQAAQGVVGGLVDRIFRKGDNKAQFKQQEKLQGLAIQGNKEMADYNWNNELKMWKETGYPAQMEQIKKAGLNPALLYGMGGTGGATTGHSSGGGVSTGSAAPSPQHIQQGMGIMQTRLLEAQTENIKADTENKKKENPNIETEGELKKIDLEYQKGSLKDRIDKTNSEAIKAVHEIDIAENTKLLGRMTRNSQAEKIYQEAIGENLANILVEAQTRATNQNIEKSKQEILQSEAQILKWAAEISQGLTRLDQTEREVELKRIETEIKANYPGLGNVLGNIVNDAVRGLTGGLHHKVNTDKPKK